MPYKDKEKARLARRAWRQRHREKYLAQALRHSKKYYAQNHDRINAAKREWNRTHPLGLYPRKPRKKPVGWVRKNHIWLQSEIDKLKAEYPAKGAILLANELGLSVLSVRGQVEKFHLHRIKDLPESKIVINKRTREHIAQMWRLLRAPQIISEKLGKRWLLNNGFDFVYVFAEHRRAHSASFRLRFPFDYYAETNGQRWFIDATTAVSKPLDIFIITLFMRFAKVAVLFVGSENCILVEITNPKTGVRITKSLMQNMEKSPEEPSKTVMV